MGIVSVYAGMAFVVMVLLAIVNTRLEVDLARPDSTPVGDAELPQYFAHSFRDMADLGLIRDSVDWVSKVESAFGKGDDLYQAGEELRLLSRPGRSLLAAATVGFTFGADWLPSEIESKLKQEIEALGIELDFRLENLKTLEDGHHEGLLSVGPWSRTLVFQFPGDVYREANALLEAEGFRIMQFDTASLNHSFALMHLPLAKKLFHSKLFQMIDPCGGDTIRPEGAPERWSTWLY